MHGGPSCALCNSREHSSRSQSSLFWIFILQSFSNSHKDAFKTNSRADNYPHLQVRKTIEILRSGVISPIGTELLSDRASNSTPNYALLNIWKEKC